CTGDPCVVNDDVVVSPCTVDFGPRQLVIRGTVGVPDAGTLDFTAATITVEGGGGIDGRHPLPGGNGGSISLHASADVGLSGSLDASGYETAGSITVEAGALLTVGGSTRANLIGHVLSTAGQDRPPGHRWRDGGA